MAGSACSRSADNNYQISQLLMKDIEGMNVDKLFVGFLKSLTKRSSAIVEID